jgi:hypothetical protein
MKKLLNLEEKKTKKRNYQDFSKISSLDFYQRYLKSRCKVYPKS